ncbi:MAG: hypothetical protein R2843_03405 [Thermomicrobiales bacterium]
MQPTIAIDLIDQLPVWLESQGFSSISDIVGIANPRFRAKLVETDAATA